jgi:hypothetical protein
MRLLGFLDRNSVIEAHAAIEPSSANLMCTCILRKMRMVDRSYFVQTPPARWRYRIPKPEAGSRFGTGGGAPARNFPCCPPGVTTRIYRKPLRAH